MTATTVNGIEVLASEAIEAPISSPGKPIHFKQTRRLLLADHTELYGCVHCDFADSRIGAVRIHLRQHRATTTPTRKTPVRTTKKSTAPALPPAPKEDSLQDASLASLTLGQLVERAQSTARVIKERDLARKERDAAREELTEWTNRATKAERSLTAIRKAVQA